MADTLQQFVVIAEFHVREGELDAFLALAHNDASESLANESGCQQFDVLLADDQANTVMLHEVYDSREAFDHHTQMPHYKPFKEGSEPLLESEPKVRFFHPTVRPQN
ncbi:putative quinol monooxygenase [Kushneria aurantia]|uniref:Quinol monooxygenase n=1 Tax=Kushneria aurantia TaxID=504092 RepID=A0ABV6G2P7_9GAMM|nr:putative quinol monooxygenase [Kushneria aurantia]